MSEVEIRTGVIKPIECVKEGFALIKSDYWLLFAIWLVGGMISSISMLIASGAMTCGIYYCYLRKIDGEKVAFEDLFKGMQWFLPGLVIMIIIVVPIILVFGVIYFPIIMSAVMGSKLSQSELMTMLMGALTVDLVIALIMVCIHTLLIFAIPLLVDKSLGVIAAMTTSARAVLKNLGGITALFVVNFGIMLAGELAFCVGVYLVVPVVLAANVVAYRKIFPSGAAA